MTHKKSIFLSIVFSKKAALKPPFKLSKIVKTKKAFSWMLRTLRAAHYLGAGPAFLARAFDFRCSSETFALWGLSGLENAASQAF
jgi:hypothetical protein